jgi:hypothetical protein
MEISNELNIGRAGEHIAIADLLLKGIQAYTTGQGVRYDVVADINGRLLRLQVKTTQRARILAKHAKPIYFFDIRRAGKNGFKKYELGQFDGFALVALDRREVYYLKFDGKIGSASICIRDRNNDYTTKKRGMNNRPGIYLQDLTWENFIKQ